MESTGMINHILNKAVAGNFEHLLKQLDGLTPTKRWKVTVSDFKSKRSLDQNSRLWKLYNDIGKHIGESPDKIHELCGFKFLRYQTVVNGETIEAIRSTTKLNTQEMTDYQDAIVRWCAEIGFMWSDV
jgi:hypothetical protein